MATPRILLSAIILLLARPALAQAPAPAPQLNADRALLVQCLRQGGEAQSGCIGLVAVSCVRTASGDRREAETGCARREEAVWRERLNQASLILLRSFDESRRSRFASLNLAWEGYVAQKCAFYGQSQREGYQVGRQAGCELREVANRAIELEKALPRPAAQRPSQPPQIIR
jgi:uncharacterized protein YecT (DUF1311 family)